MRFQIGEVAKVVVSKNPDYIGCLVTILDAGRLVAKTTSFPDGAIWDYEITHPAGKTKSRMFCMDYCLQKLNPPAEPASLTRHTEKETTK